MFRLFTPKRLEKWIGWLWGLVLLALPVTSFRYYPPLFGRTTIQPLAIYPLLLLLPLLFLELVRRRRLPLPVQAVPLAAFLLLALVATLLGGFLAPLEFRGAVIWDRALRAWFSLAFGLSFFFAAYLVSRLYANLGQSLKWLYAGLALSFAWGIVQAVAINTPLLTKSFIREVQLSFSLRPTMNRRISGFAFEPSWLSDQMVILYLPWLLGALLTGYRAFRRRWIEPLLAAAALALLLLTYSRSGMLGVLLSTGVLALVVGGKSIQRAWAWYISPLRAGGQWWPGRITRLGIALLGIGALTASFLWLNSYPYFSNLWHIGLDEGLITYVVKNGAGPRLASAIAGYRVFADHPWFGVGLGGSGLELFRQYPQWAEAGLPELARHLSPDSSLIPNIRSLYLRLLAETGVLGFWAYIAFYLSLLGGAARLLRRAEPLYRYVGAAGLCVWTAVAIRNFTQDSFATPIIWVPLGIMVGYASLINTERNTPEGD